ncbi:MAG: hypothetical protein ACI4DO_07305 [Roseburia sp.]
MEPILEYRGEFKKGRLGAKKYPLRLALYPSHIEGEGFWIEGSGDLSQYTISININMPQIRKATEVEINGEIALQIEYMKYQSYDGTKEYVIILGVQNCDEWIDAIARTKEEYFENEKREKDLAYKKRLEEKEAAARRAEEEAARKAQEEEARLAAEAAEAAARAAEEAKAQAEAEAARIRAEEEAKAQAEAEAARARAEEEARAQAEAEAKAAAAARAREEAEMQARAEAEAQARAEAEAARAREEAAAAKAAEEAKMLEERALEELAAKALAQAEEAARAAKADENITAASQEETVSEPITHMGEEEAEMSDEKITVDEFKEKLDKLMLLKEAGILSEAEFSTEKAKLISLM